MEALASAIHAFISTHVLNVTRLIVAGSGRVTVTVGSAVAESYPASCLETRASPVCASVRVASPAGSMCFYKWVGKLEFAECAGLDVTESERVRPRLSLKNG